jgi:iron complex outermembrane recepter protein
MRVPHVFVLFFLLLAAPLLAQQTINGKVIDPQGQPVPDATVTLLELRRSTKVAADGSFTFASVDPGHYHVVVESRRAGAIVAEAEVTSGAPLAMEITLDPAVHSEEIVVTASPEARRESEVYQPVNVLTSEELTKQIQPTLGETLSREPGVSSTYFGPGASRPIIRGLGSDRIRVLEEGVGTGDASNVSPDHAVSVDPGSARQIEIVRGPATLLYGSNAVGGVVNVIDDRIPNRVPSSAITGSLDLRLGTVSDEKNGTVALDGGIGRFAWHAGFLNRSTGDYEIPTIGKLENSSLETSSATAGASYIVERGFLGISLSGFETNYGVPGAEEEGVRIDMEQRRLDLKGELRNLGIFRNLRLRMGSSAYEHVELEGDEIGTRFTNEAFEARVEGAHRDFGALRGSIGMQYTTNDFEAVGEEAFIAPNQTDAFALFAFEEFTAGKFDLQFGARYESQNVSIDDVTLPDRSFDGLSGSIGAILKAGDGYSFAASLSRATRIPTATELYANGPHVATRQFEVGNADLDSETSMGIDLSIRRTSEKFRASVTLFQNYFEGYIFDAPTGAEEDGLPVFAYVQHDARFQGIELETHSELWHAGDRHLELELGLDYVHAALDGGDHLPRIPPLRGLVGLQYQAGPLSAGVELQKYGRQGRIAAYETPTDDYTLVSANIGYRFFAASTVHDVILRGTNLTNELARVHTSPLKDFVPLPGRDLAVAYRVTF